MEQEIFCVPLRSTPKNSRIHPSDPPTTRKGLRPLQPRKEERTVCLPPTFLASFAESLQPAADLLLSALRARSSSPGCVLAAQLRPYGRTALFRHPRSLEAVDAITPRCARRHRIHCRPTNPTRHHKGRCPLASPFPISTANGSLAAHAKEENFKESKQTLDFWRRTFSWQRAEHFASRECRFLVTTPSPNDRHEFSCFILARR